MRNCRTRITERKWIEFPQTFFLFSFIRWEFVVSRFGFCRTPLPLSIRDLFATRIRDRATCTRVPFHPYAIHWQRIPGGKKNRLLLTVHITNYLEAAPPLRYVPMPRIISLYTPKCSIISPVFAQFFCFLPPISGPRTNQGSIVTRLLFFRIHYESRLNRQNSSPTTFQTEKIYVPSCNSRYTYIHPRVTWACSVRMNRIHGDFTMPCVFGCGGCIWNAHKTARSVMNDAVACVCVCVCKVYFINTHARTYVDRDCITI